LRRITLILSYEKTDSLITANRLIATICPQQGKLMGIDDVFLAVGLLSKFDGDMKLILYEGKKYCFFSTALPIVLHLKLLANLLNAHQLKYVLTIINYRNGASMLKPSKYI
jgi:hypothetical protein